MITADGYEPEVIALDDIQEYTTTDPEQGDLVCSMELIQEDVTSKKDKAQDEDIHEIDLSKVPKIYRDLSIVKETPRNYLNEHTLLDLCLDSTNENAFWQEPMIPLSYEKQKFATQKLQDMLSKGFIEKSTSPRYCNMFLVPKKGSEKYRMVINYKPLNAVTKDFKYPMRSYKDTVVKFSRESHSHKAWFENACYLLRIREGDKPKNSVCLCGGNIPIQSCSLWTKECSNLIHEMRFITTILIEFLSRCCIVDMDDILIYSQKQNNTNETFERFYRV